MLLAILVLLGLALVGPACADVAAPPIRPRQRPDGAVELSLRAPHARLVAVAGSFNGWSTGRDTAVDPDGDGVWTFTAWLGPGRHEYLFFVDGQAPFHGARADALTAPVFQSHQPFDLDVRGTVSVFVLRIDSGGRAVEAPEDPARYHLLDAARLRFVGPDGVDSEQHRRALEANTRALAAAPVDAWCEAQRVFLESAARTEQEIQRTAALREEEALQPLVAALERSDWLGPAEKALARDLSRQLGRGESGRQEIVKLARLVLADRAREELAQSRARPAMGSTDLRAIFDYRALLADARGGMATDWVRRECPELFRPLEATGVDRDLLALLAAPSGSEQPGFSPPPPSPGGGGLGGGQSEDNAPLLLRISSMLRARGFFPGLVALGPRLLAGVQERAAGLELLQSLPTGSPVQRWALLWLVSLSPRLRDDPRIAEMLADGLTAEHDALMTHVLAVRLSYVYLTARAEHAFYELLENRLRADPYEVELLANFRAFLGSLDALEADYPGLLANPWRGNLAGRLRRLQAVAPSNRVLSTMLAEALVHKGDRDEASLALLRLSTRWPGDPAAAAMLAELEERSGHSAVALEVLNRCWTERAGDAEIGRRRARLTVMTQGPEAARPLLETGYPRVELAVQTALGATEGLLATTGATAALGVLRGWRPASLEARLTLRRARIRLAAACFDDAALEEELAARRGESPVALAELLHYASSAARAAGRDGPADHLLERALETAAFPRRWILEGARLGQPEAARKMAALGVSRGGAVAPFVRHLARDALARGDDAEALRQLTVLDALAESGVEHRGLRAGLSVSQARAGCLSGAVATLVELARGDRSGMLFVFVALALPLAFCGLLAVRYHADGPGGLRQVEGAPPSGPPLTDGPLRWPNKP